MVTGAALVIGAGIGGIKCALDMAESGFKVYLCDRSPNIGGTLSQLDKWFPDNHCGMCKILPIFSRDESSQYCLRRGLFHPNIELLPLTTVEKVEGEAGDFKATLRVQPRGVKEELCIGCGLCTQVCPVEVGDEFNEGLQNRKAIHLRSPLAMSNSYTIDWDRCTKCDACVEKCPTNAIDLSQKEETRELEVGAIVLATGFEEFAPGPWTQYGYGRYPNVITSIELERILSPNGPSAGELVRPSDDQPPKSMAFFQCVGSRNTESDYCSSACCMYAIKEAMLVKEKNPEVDVEIFYMDMRAFGKGYHRYYEQAKDNSGVKFTRCRVPALKQDPKTKDLFFTAKAEDGKPERREFELVVLSVGQTPSPRFRELTQVLDLELNRWGFCQTKALSPVETSREGIYVCGSASAPKDIADTLAEADAAACQVSKLLSPQRNQLTDHRTFPEEIDPSEEETRVAVFLCRCGEEISSAINLEEMVYFAKSFPGVAYAEEVPYLCLKDALEDVKERIKAERVNRVVLAGCSVIPHKRLFTEAIRDVGLNPSLLELVDLREQLSWTHQDQKAATEKAKSLVSIAVEKIKAQRPMPITTQAIEHWALVVGGGLSGLTAALCLAEQGFEVHLAERADELGGHLRHINTTLESGEPQVLLQELITRAETNPLVNIYKETELVEASGHAGNFTVTLKAKDSTLQPMKVGAIIIATGAQEYEPSEYLYGQTDSVITHQELERRLTSGDLDPQKLNSVVMIQCVGSRDSERPYCSRICCSQALKNSLNLKESNPDINVFVLYRDVMSYGFKEEYYTQAREKGVLFISYDLEHKPQVNIGGNKLEVQVMEPTLGGNLKIEPDLLVLSPAIVPNDNGPLARMLGLELTEDGFFKEAEVKFRPVDFLTDGIFVCGLAHSPRGIAESIVQAQAAAQRAASILAREQLESGRVVAEVNERRCSGCELCVSVCPYNARFKDREKGVVVVVEVLCQGCGACAAICPNSAAKLRGFTDRQALSMVDAAL